MTEEEANALGYFGVKTFPDGTQAALFKMLFTTAIVYDIDDWGYADRWCYETVEDAAAALDAWDGEAEPTGWHRHPPTGWRMGEDGPYMQR